MPSPEQLGHAGLAGWRKTVADRVAPPAASRSPLSEEQIRAAIGALFFVLSVVYVGGTVARAVKAARR
jgi:hypothetical protein